MIAQLGLVDPNAIFVYTKHVYLSIEIRFSLIFLFIFMHFFSRITSRHERLCRTHCKYHNHFAFTLLHSRTPLLPSLLEYMCRSMGVLLRLCHLCIQIRTKFKTAQYHRLVSSSHDEFETRWKMSIGTYETLRQLNRTFLLIDWQASRSCRRTNKKGLRILWIQKSECRLFFRVRLLQPLFLVSGPRFDGRSFIVSIYVLSSYREIQTCVLVFEFLVHNLTPFFCRNLSHLYEK